MEPSFAGKVTVQGANLADGTPLWFQLGGRNIVSTAVFESNSPGTLIQPGEWGEWPSYLIAPKAGCYYLEAKWNGGSWKLNIAVGR